MRHVCSRTDVQRVPGSGLERYHGTHTRVMSREDPWRAARSNEARAVVGRRVVELLDVQLIGNRRRARPAARGLSTCRTTRCHLGHPDPVRGRCLSRRSRMLAKTELFRIPLWGRALRAAEFVEVDAGTTRVRCSRIAARGTRLLLDGVTAYYWRPKARARSTLPDREAEERWFHAPRSATGAAIVPVAIRRHARHPCPAVGKGDAVRPAGVGPESPAARGRRVVTCPT